MPAKPILRPKKLQMWHLVLARRGVNRAYL